MKSSYIIGVDLSKKTLDLACHNTQCHLKVANNQQGLNEMLNWLKQQKISLSNVIVVMEHTGHCSWLLEAFLHEHSIGFAKVPALAIRRSLGLVRGKTDKIDAFRIARYGHEKQDKLVRVKKTSTSLERLRLLHSIRERFVKNRAAMICALKEYKTILAKDDLIILQHQQMINAFNLQIKQLEEQIQQIIEQGQDIKKNYELVCSINGIGKVTAVASIIRTSNFTSFPNARKFCCYCGAAPFEHSSGSSIRKKARVSHLADKAMKTLLDLAAKSAIQYDEEIKMYYKRRVKEGKSKLSTINIIRNKLIYRMFAVIKRGTPFVDHYKKLA